MICSIKKKTIVGNVKRIADCDCLDTEKTHDALSREGFRKEKIKRAGKGPDASAVLLEKSGISALRGRMLSTESDSFFTSEDAPAGMAHPVPTKYSETVERKAFSRKRNGVEKT